MNENYFKTNLIVACFGVPAVISTFLIIYLSQLKSSVRELSFFIAFKNSYLIQLISGILSIGFIYLFMNYIDVSARDVFNYQRADLNYKNAKTEIENAGADFKNLNAEQGKKQAELTLKSLKSIRDNNTINFFSFSETFFVAFIFVISIFYLLLSAILSLFLRNKSIR